MDLKDLIKRYSEEKDESSERYFSGILSFFQWTTTFAFAVIIWIGTNAHEQHYQSNFLLFLSIIFILVAIAISIVTTYLILDSWNEDRKLKFHLHNLLVLSDVEERYPTDMGKRDIQKARENVLESSKSMFILKRFDRHLIFHICTLLIGIILYLLAIYW
jgi:hypothetical protein